MILFTAGLTKMFGEESLFFSGKLTAIGEGAGTIDFDFADALGTDAADAPIDCIDAGTPLTYTAIPGPGTIALCLVPCAGLTVRRRR